MIKINTNLYTLSIFIIFHPTTLKLSEPLLCMVS